MDLLFLYSLPLLSDRNFRSLVGSPWGTRQPDPYFDANEKIYHVALEKGTRSPFRANDELYNGEEKEDKKKKTDDKAANGENGESAKKEDDGMTVKIDVLSQRG